MLASACADATNSSLKSKAGRENLHIQTQDEFEYDIQRKYEIMLAEQRVKDREELMREKNSLYSSSSAQSTGSIGYMHTLLHAYII